MVRYVFLMIYITNKCFLGSINYKKYSLLRRIKIATKNSKTATKGTYSTIHININKTKIKINIS